MPYSVLLVDDDPHFRSEFSELLSDFDVTGLPNGNKAIEALKKPHHFDLIILDQNMPGMKGIDLISKIKKLSSSTRVVILTGQSSKDLAVEALRKKAVDFIEKPLNARKVRKIRELVLSAPGGERQHNAEGLQGKIEQAKHFAERNYTKNLTLKSVASEVALSPKYFSRVFKMETGMTFTQYRLKVKVDKSKDMLLKGETVGDVSEKLGYRNPESFVRVFKNVAGCTPLSFRDQNKGAPAEYEHGSVSNLDINDLKADKSKLVKEKAQINKVVRKKENKIRRLSHVLEEEKYFSELGRMAATVAHELKHPLGVIQTAVWNIKKKSTSKKYDKNISSIEKMIEQCELVIDNLLNYSKIKEPSFDLVDPRAFFLETVELARQAFSGDGPEIKADLSGLNRKKALFDPVQLRQVILNLISNAEDALKSKRDGVIRITSYDQDGDICVTVEDNGRGIPESDLPHIFDPFFTRKAKGTGLGLSVCHQIIKAHHGTLDVTSIPNKRTTFHLQLPSEFSS